MRITGIEHAPQDVLDLLGKCEVCGAQATVLVQDFFVIVKFLQWKPEDIQTAGLHRFCAEHERDSQQIKIREGPDAL